MAKARDFSRLDRVGSTIRRVLAEPVNERARAARVGLATITAVDLSPDLRRATVRLSVFGGDGEADRFVAALNADAHALQAVLGTELRTRRTPVLKFMSDDALERADRVNRLLAGRSPADEPHT